MSFHPWIILFDIDGTLLTVNHTFNRALIRGIIDELNIDYPDMEKDSFSGRTDFDIISSFLVNHDNKKELYPQFKASYLTRLSEQIKPHHLLRHSHVDEALEYFSSPTFIRGLLTGNYPDAAAVKLCAANIRQEFSFGAFGEFHSDRNMLPNLALKHIQDTLDITPNPHRFLIIGDTPRDIICAKNACMKCVAVTTGKFSQEELAEYEPDLIIDSLAHPADWFEIIASS